MQSRPNFWLKSVLLPFTYLQRLRHTGMPQSPYHLPAEWASHQRTLMSWPDRISVERDDQLHRVRTELANIAEIIARYEPVWLYSGHANGDAARAWVSSTNLTVKETDLEQLWIRDTGPVFAKASTGHVIGVDLKFNYWGSKLSFPRMYDATFASRMLKEERVGRAPAPFVSEGGALEVDGDGTLLATESSILNPNRNPGVSRTTVERHFRNLFGVTKIIWLPGASGLEITDGHIDSLARFAPNDTVLLSRPSVAIPEDDPSWRIYKQAKEILRSSTNAAGRSLRVVEVEEAPTVPYARIADSGEQLATSYLNYYLPNGAVIVP